MRVTTAGGTAAAETESLFVGGVLASAAGVAGVGIGADGDGVAMTFRGTCGGTDGWDSKAGGVVTCTACGCVGLACDGTRGGTVTCGVRDGDATAGVLETVREGVSKPGSSVFARSCEADALARTKNNAPAVRNLWRRNQER